MLTSGFAASRERIGLWAIGAVLALVLALHAAMETLYALPVNPLGERFRPVVLAYMHPYFEQSWNMFAPTPIESDVTVLARTRTANGTQSGWVDLTAPLLSDLRAHPFSRYSTLKIAAMNVAISALDDPALGRGGFTLAQQRAFADPRTRPLALEGLVRLALFLGAAGATHPAGVQIAILEHRFPRFTHRFDPDDQRSHNSTLTFPWLPVEPDALEASS